MTRNYNSKANLMRITSRSIFFVLLFISAGASASNPSVTYDALSRRLSVDVQQMPLQEFLAAVAAQTGLHVETALDAPRPLTLRMKDVTLESALKSALRGTSYMMKYDTGKDGKPVLRGVRVVAKGEAAPNSTGNGQVSSAHSAAASAAPKAQAPEQQRQQKIARILEAHRQRDGLPATQRLNVINRPTTPARSPAAGGSTKATKRERQSSTAVGSNGRTTTARHPQQSNE